MSLNSPSITSVVDIYRPADTGDVAARHASDARQRSVALLFRLLHIRHRRCSAVGWTSASALRPSNARQRVSRRVRRNYSGDCCVYVENKKPSYRRDTARRSVLCEIRIRIAQGHWKSADE